MSDTLQTRRTADGSLTLYNPRLDECYHSVHGATTESTLVFLQHSDLVQRLAAGPLCRVLEIGFGTGLNFFLSARLALQTLDCRLSYTTIEMQPIAPDVIAELAAHNLDPLDAEAARLIDNTVQALTCPDYLDACHNGANGARLSTSLSPAIDLTLVIENARTAALPAAIDVIYLDAFSGRNNPELWERDFLRALCGTLQPDGCLVTFSVNRAFRDALNEAGFSWQRRPGPPGKRQVLFATPGLDQSSAE